MKQLLAIALVWVMSAGAVHAAEKSFSKAVQAEEFAAAGLGKLSPEELARLDVLVRAYKSGAVPAAEGMADKLAAARREATEASQARAAAESRVARAEAEMRAAKAEAAKAEMARAAAAKAQADAAKEKKPDTSLLARAKVLLTPGTEIEYSTVETRIAGDFKGWEGRAVFTLENGQRWQVANGGLYSTPPISNPKVKIAPATMGGFWMTIEGVAVRVKVLPFGAK